MIETFAAAPGRHQWLAVLAELAAFGALLLALRIYDRRRSPHPEVLRKLLHTGAGLLTLPFPFLFTDVWPVLVLTGCTFLFFSAVRFLDAWRRRFGAIAGRVGRTTFGELYFPAAVAVVFCLAHGRPPLFFVVPILVLTVADAACALVGMRYGVRRYARGDKTVEGSIAFFATAFLCLHAPLRVWTGLEPVDSLLIAATAASVLALIEAGARRGRDNFLVPLCCYLLLRRLLALDDGALRACFAAATALTGLVMVVLLREPPAVLSPRRGQHPGCHGEHQ